MKSVVFLGIAPRVSIGCLVAFEHQGRSPCFRYLGFFTICWPCPTNKLYIFLSLSLWWWLVLFRAVLSVESNFAFVFVLHYYALWLVNKTRATFSTNFFFRTRLILNGRKCYCTKSIYVLTLLSNWRYTKQHFCISLKLQGCYFPVREGLRWSGISLKNIRTFLPQNLNIKLQNFKT